MSAIVIAALSLAVASGGAMLGACLGRLLPGHHLNAESRDAIKLAIGLIATLSAIVLGMLISLASGIYQTQRGQLQRFAAETMLLERTLEFYGPEADEARAALRRAVVAEAGRLWTPGAAAGAGDAAALDARALSGDLWKAFTALQPRDEDQRAIKSHAIAVLAAMGEARTLLLIQRDTVLPVAILGVLVAWIGLIFAGFGFLAPPNPTVGAVLFAAALCVGGAFFVLIELARPFDGLLALSEAPLRDAIAQLGR